MMLLSLLLLVAQPQESVTTRLYRIVQGGTEIGRETYRRSAARLERSVVVPLLNLRLDTHVEYGSEGRVRRFSGETYNTAGDSLRGRFDAVVQADSIVVTVASNPNRPLVIKGGGGGGADGFIPAQSVSVVAEASEKAGRRDTLFRFAAMGVDTMLPVRVSHRNDTTIVEFAGVRGYLAGSDPTIRIPVGSVVASVWNGVDSLPPLAGLHPPKVSYDPPAGASYTAEQVRVTIQPAKADSFTLAATLSLPKLGQRPFPAVVMMSGSGQQDRDENLWPLLPEYRPFREYTERLAREGIAVLRYDDRMTGQSGGRPGGTTADFADDVRQLVAWLRTRPEIDGARIGLIGHSEGGVMGPLVASQDPGIKALVILAGSAKPGRAVLRDQFVWPLKALPADERQRLLPDIDRQVDEWLQQNAWTRWFAGYDPLVTARKLRLPVLIQQGALDRQVSAGQADTLAAAIRGAGNPDVTVKLYPRLNHLFLPTEGDGSPSEYGALRHVTLPQEVLDDTARWLAERLRR